MNRFSTSIKHTPGITMDLPVVVLSSTINRKMANCGPKFQHQIGDDILFNHQLKTIKNKFPTADVTLCVGNGAVSASKMKSEWEIDDVKIIENQGWKETSEIEALRLALNILPNLSNILIVMGDLYFQKDSLGFLEFGKSSINYQVEDNQDIGLNFDIGKDNRLNGLGFDLKAKWSGLCYMTGKELEILKKFCSPKNCRMEVWEFFKYAIKNFGNIKCCPDNGKCVRINTRDKMREICAG